MPDRHLPVRPDLRQLKVQAKELLRALRAGAPDALEELRRHHPDAVDPAAAKLAHAQLVLARAYGVPSWPRLVQACELVDAIWRDDVDAVRRLVTANPRLIHESALVRESNWGPPMSYAANLGRDRIIRVLHAMGATDLLKALDRAALQGRVETARILHAMMERPTLSEDALEGPAYTLSASGTELLFELGARALGENGERLAPVDIVLETDSRKPAQKHAILEMYVQRGVELPDTPPMAVHRGRIDLLEAQLRRDPSLLRRTFSHEEIYPPELGCHDEVLATHGTPLKGATLLHMCVDYDEMGIALWLLERGMDPDVRAAVDEEGFGGHTPLFASVVSQTNYTTNLGHGPDDARFTRLLLDRGADRAVRASLRKQLHPGYGETEPRVYRDVTAREWGERFHRQEFVSRRALEMVRSGEW